MKYIIFCLFSVLIIASCNRNQDCYDCKTDITISIREPNDSSSFNVSDSRTLCDKTEAEIRDYELMNSDTSVYLNGPVRIDTIIVTTCKPR